MDNVDESTFTPKYSRFRMFRYGIALHIDTRICTFDWHNDLWCWSTMNKFRFGKSVWIYMWSITTEIFSIVQISLHFVHLHISGQFFVLIRSIYQRVFRYPAVTVTGTDVQVVRHRRSSMIFFVYIPQLMFSIRYTNERLRQFEFFIFRLSLVLHFLKMGSFTLIRTNRVDLLFV